MRSFGACVERAKGLRDYLAAAAVLKDFVIPETCDYFAFRVKVPKNDNNIAEISCSVPVDTNEFRSEFVIETAPFDENGNIIYGLRTYDLGYCESNQEVVDDLLLFVNLPKQVLEDYEEN